MEAREPAAPAARETEGAAAETAPGMETAAAEPSAPDTQALLVEANEKYLRAKAELENYRKRVQREFAEIRQYTKQATIEEFLSVYDHFQMALAHADETPNCQEAAPILGPLPKSTLGRKIVSSKALSALSAAQLPL